MNVKSQHSEHQTVLWSHKNLIVKLNSGPAKNNLMLPRKEIKNKGKLIQDLMKSSIKNLFN